MSAFFPRLQMCSFLMQGYCSPMLMELSTDTAAILNLLDLRSIMGYPVGMSTIRYSRSVFTRAFLTNFSLSFPGKGL